MPRFRGFLFAAALAVGMGGAAAAMAQASPTSPPIAVHYHLVKSVPLGAPNSWDYAVYDPSSNRLFVAHGNRLTVVDGRSGRIVGQVGPIPGGPHGTAFDPAAGVGITDDGRLGQAVIFDLKTLAIVKRLKVQRGADAVAFDPVSGHAFVIDGDTGEIAVIDPARRRVVTFIHIGGDLEYAVSGDNGKLYVNGVTHHEIFRIDTATNRVDASWPMPQCKSPHGLAIDTRTHRLFSSCENQRLVVVNSENGAAVAAVPIGRGTDADRFDPMSHLIFSSNGFDGTLSIIREVDANSFVPAATVKTALSARTMGIDIASGRVYLLAAHTTQKAMEDFRAQWRKTHHRPHHSPFAAGSLKLLVFDPGRVLNH
ncbi:MAG: YncE family protein [Steroidobacteraceae bacterium]